MQNESLYYQYARDFALKTNRSIFVTGKAGTGKTTFLHKLKTDTAKQTAIVAPTGIAAINAGGTTIHSFFQLPFSPFIPTIDGRKQLIEKIKMQGTRRRVLQELELLVIDEISMVRADVLDAIDTILRNVRYRYREPFGGVQLIFIGDMFQLSPVASNEEWQILSKYYESQYFFHSHVTKEQQPLYIEFDKIFRQTNADFISVLNEVRNNRLSDNGLKLLQSRYNPSFQPTKNDGYIILTTHNYKADKINNEELASIKEKTYTFEAKIEGDFPEKAYPTEKQLTLKVGAKVMFIKNDTEQPRRFFNGKIGVIESISDKNITIIATDDQSKIVIEPMLWENVKYTADEKTKKLNEEIVGRFIQYPLRLAWAITIHKSQGLTFDKTVIDAGEAFAPGQVYVALSRCRSLEGIVLWSQINPYSISNDKEIVNYEHNKADSLFLEQQLLQSKNEFRLFVLEQLFDFKVIIAYISRLIRDFESVKSSFNSDTEGFLQNILRQTQDLSTVADKFHGQLKNIFQDKNFNEDYLTQRLVAAFDFFKPKIKNLVDTILQSPAKTDSRNNAKDYNEQLQTFFSFTYQKFHIMDKLSMPFDIDQFFVVKNTLLLPDFNVNSYNKENYTPNTNVRNKDLLFELIAIRNNISDLHNLPIYLVAGSKTLNEMAENLPQTESQLLKINGFGKVKVAQFGQQFLDAINKYCEKNNLSTNIDYFSSAKKEKIAEKKEKKEKGDTYRLTYELYKKGKSIEEIATERSLATSTIAGHLLKYIANGELEMSEFISLKKCEQAYALFKQNTDTGSVYQMLEKTLEKHEIPFFLAWKRGLSENQSRDF